MLQNIGPYRIERELGRGGMGVVYLARDTRLEREVAIKALPADFAGDAGRLARFQREAKVLASLNHPGVASIYGLEQIGSEHYIVLEYVEGESLATRLSRGALPLDEALEIAKQIAEAVEAAHEKGIVHRDLKPGNVMLRSDGVVKVLDFGLARTGDEPPSSSRSAFHPESPTVTSPAMPVNSPTLAGAILGTAGYMSPEQARGKSVDKRSDIFSFGCVLYEMLTGAQPFRGETVTDSLGATLHRDVEWGLLPPGTPTGVRLLLRRCLNKSKHDRLHDIGDARIALADAISGADEAALGAGPARPKRSGTGLAVGAAVVGMALVGGTWLVAARFARPAAAPELPVYLDIPSRTQTYRDAQGPVISPDGRHIVFSARSIETGVWSLWIRPLDSLEARVIAETKEGGGAFWSWDGRSIAFNAEGKLWSVDPIRGGARRLIAAESGGSGAWSADGTIIATRVDSPWNLVKFPASGGKAEPITELDGKAFEKLHTSPRFLPDGERFMYLGVRFDPDQEVRAGRLYAGRLGSAERNAVADMISEFWVVENGWLVFVEDGTIKAAPFDMNELKMTGDAVTIADGVYFFRATGSSNMSVARDGTIAFQSPPEGGHLVWFDLNGVRQGEFGPKGLVESFRIAPDGSQVVVGVTDRRTGACDLWLHGIGRASTTHLTTDARWENYALWSRDGSTIYFSWDRSDAPYVYSISADGSGKIEEFFGQGASGNVWIGRDTSPDGTSMLLTGSVEKQGRDLLIVPLDGSRKAVPFRSTPANEDGGRFSPDGKWIAFESDESGRTEVYLAPYPGPGPKVQVSAEGGSRAVWSPGGDRLYFRRWSGAELAGGERSKSAAIMVVELDKPESFRSPPAPRVLFETAEPIDEFDITPDGKRLLLLLLSPDSPPMHVVLNGLPARR